MNNVSNILQLLILANQAALQFSTTVSEVSELLSRAQSEGRDVTPEELEEFRSRRQQAVDEFLGM